MFNIIFNPKWNYVATHRGTNIYVQLHTRTIRAAFARSVEYTFSNPETNVRVLVQKYTIQFADIDLGMFIKRLGSIIELMFV